MKLDQRLLSATTKAAVTAPQTVTFELARVVVFVSTLAELADRAVGELFQKVLRKPASYPAQRNCIRWAYA